MRKYFLTMALTVASIASAEVIDISQVQYFGPVKASCTIDGSKASAAELMKQSITPRPETFVTTTLSSLADANTDEPAVNLIAFSIENQDFVKATLQLDGMEQKEVKVDGKKVDNMELSLTPATHTVEIKYITDKAATAPSVKINAEGEGKLRQVTDGKRIFSLDDVLFGTRINRAAISCDGAYLLADYSDLDVEGNNQSYQRLYDLRTNAPIAHLEARAQWMPDAPLYYIERKNHDLGRHIVTIDPKTGKESVYASHLPEGNMQVMPGGKYLLYDLVREGHKENDKVYQIVEPEDRQPGWRNRHYPALLPLDGTNAMQPLASGKQNVYVADISADGSKLLLMSSHSRLEKRPTTVTTVMLYDVNTAQLDTLVKEDGFVSRAKLSPDATKVLLAGTPEALDGVGRTTEATPSMTETELFIIDANTHEVKPITRDFNPSIENAEWNRQDGKIYARVEERDIYTVYQIDPATAKYQQVVLPENIVKGLDLANTAPVMAWWGQSDSNPDRLYVTNIKNGKHTLLDNPSAERLKDVRIAQCQDWNFENRNGDIVYGRFYLPDDFDPSKKYPLIVNYYGGCSPSQRLFESRYPWHVYAQQGYVVYVVNPSGATGFGQEWASRHVNTAGQGVAEDILEGVDKFVAEHPYVDNDRVGCIGASYGGFMTQFLQTLTDRFACAISHAGISDHTSYWGEGYWGYSYSEVSMANSYPWSNPELYVKQSPLFRADKIHTPLLLVHGDGDTNVPPGESIQMFTALKLLERPTALVMVKDQDHHIKDTEKRKLWQDTIFAWFAKYLKNDSAWWDSMYPGAE